MIALRFLSLLAITAINVQGFVVPSSPSSIIKPAFAPSTALHVNIPRITLPDPIPDALSSIDLKNPNELSTEEYNSYSGAAIAGTLIFFLLPGALVSGMYDVVAEFLSAAVKDFAFSALIGGGLAAYLSLRKDSVSESANNLGSSLLEAVDKVLEG